MVCGTISVQSLRDGTAAGTGTPTDWRQQEASKHALDAVEYIVHPREEITESTKGRYTS